MKQNSPYPITLPNGDKWKHTVYLKDVIDHPNIKVGEHTYYNDFRSDIDDYAKIIAPYLHPHVPENLVIGKFVQIAHGIQFITSSANHAMAGFSTYPFFVFDTWKDQAPPPKLSNKGDTVIGNDCWLGHNVTTMPGITIGNGVIVGSNTTVTKDVPDYAIVAGNPGKIIKMRFNPDEIKILNHIKWRDWPEKVIQENISAITSSDIDQLEAIYKIEIKGL